MRMMGAASRHRCGCDAMYTWLSGCYTGRSHQGLYDDGSWGKGRHAYHVCYPGTPFSALEASSTHIRITNMSCKQTLYMTS
jgi:hypothetical protein